MKNLRRFGYGSAAALMGISGAQAADLPVKAKAIEYVKVCSLYGPGFYYIPGTDTCIKLGGYLRAEMIVGSNSDFLAAYSGVGGAQNRLGNAYTVRTREDLNIDTRTASEYGTVRTYADFVFSWTTDGYGANPAAPGSTVYSPIGGSATVSPASAPLNANAGAIAYGTLGVYHAFIQFAGFTIGRTVSQFDAPWTGYPGNNYDGLTGGGNTITGVNQFTYTAQFGQGVSVSLSAQDQAASLQSNIWNTSLLSAAGVLAGAYGGNDQGGLIAPDFVGMLRVDQDWGLFQASVAAHDNHAAYNGATELTGHPNDKWGWAGQLALSIKNIPTGPGDTINMSGVYTNGASRYNFDSLVPQSYAMYGGTGLAGAYQSIGIAGVSDAVFAPGGDLQLTTTYGFRAAYTHNWNPYWNTAVYGAYGAVRYNANAKGLICGSAAFGAGGLGLTGTCNPDFNLSTIGTVTRWTPVKNLTFHAELAYTELDQKYSGTVTAPAAATIAKPAATYELKDQHALVLMLKAQRNW